jgi:hypothetical protein
MSSDCLPHQASNAEKADLHAELAALASTGMLDGIKKLDREIWELEVPLMTADDPGWPSDGPQMATDGHGWPLIATDGH